MSVWALIFLFLFVTAASFTQRVTGFGFGIIVMTVLPYLLPSYGEATALSGLLAVFTALLPAVRMRRLLPWRKLAVILPVFLLVSFFAVRLVTRVDSDLLRHILGGVLVAVSVYFICVSGRFRLPPRLDVQAGMGALSGLMGGLFAMQGPPAVIYFLGCADSKEEYIALTQWYFLIGNAAMSLFRAGNGLVTPTVLRMWCIALPGVFLGLWLGARVFSRLRADVFRKVVYGFLAVAGLAALLA
ncbi:MAG: sulfite exporter TauE/SafE family protein [Bacteroidales bacterium]|nr:sulfite exporter TauE/SafE family protein [Bacteroidales bacterium]MBR1577524.1 sulfite exporter TauE/SafE family protein [Bacteroidales bacterium]